MEYPAVIGIGRTKFGEHYEKEPEKLVEEAGLKALDSARIERRDLDACYFSDYFLSITNKIGIEEGFMSELLELNIPMEVTRSFSSALFNACNAISCGRYEIVLVGGVEKMTDRWDKIRDDLMLLEDPWSYYAGCTPEANHELMLRSYLKKYGIPSNSKEFNYALAYIAVKNHRFGTKNEYAQFQRELSLEKVLSERERVSPKPLGRYDFAPISDGAAAVILADKETAKSYSPLAEILASASATDFITFPLRKVRTAFEASRIAMESALQSSGIEIEEIGMVEVYDQSTFLEMICLEDLGFFERGKGWKNIYESFEENKDFYEANGKKIYVNTNGGLKADGNPLGATGGAQLFEIVSQLSGKAGSRQVDKFEVGCMLELEGFGTKAYVHLIGEAE